MNDWMKQRDLLMQETLAFAQSVAANTQKVALTPVHQPDASQGFASSVQRPIALTELAPTDTPDMERTAILRQVANFKAHQQRFQREREDYF
jgi:CTP:molybdopterin cytidylyltransferase MocA